MRPLGFTLAVGVNRLPDMCMLVSPSFKQFYVLASGSTKMAEFANCS